MVVFGLLFTEDFLEVVEFFRDTAAALFLTKSAKKERKSQKNPDHPNFIPSLEDPSKIHKIRWFMGFENHRKSLIYKIASEAS